MRHFALLTLTAVVLAGCSTGGPGLDPQRGRGDIDVPDVDGADRVGGSCGAGEMGYLVGQQVEEVDLETLARTVRPIYPDTAITEDYRPGRVNLDLTADGVILRVWCG